MIGSENCRFCGEKIPSKSIYCQTHAEISVEEFTFCIECNCLTRTGQRYGVVRGSVGISGVPRSATSYHKSGPKICTVCLTPHEEHIFSYHRGLDVPLSEYPLENNHNLRSLLMTFHHLSAIILIAFLVSIIFLPIFWARISLSLSVVLWFFIWWNSEYGFARDRRVEFHSKGYAGHTLTKNNPYKSKELDSIDIALMELLKHDKE